MNYKRIGISYSGIESPAVGYTEFIVGSSLNSSFHEVSIPLIVRSGSEIVDIFIGRLRFAENAVTFVGNGKCRLSSSGVSFGTNGCGVRKVIGFK